METKAMKPDGTVEVVKRLEQRLFGDTVELREKRDKEEVAACIVTALADEARSVRGQDRASSSNKKNGARNSHELTSGDPVPSTKSIVPLEEDIPKTPNSKRSSSIVVAAFIEDRRVTRNATTSATIGKSTSRTDDQHNMGSASDLMLRPNQCNLKKYWKAGKRKNAPSITETYHDKKARVENDEVAIARQKTSIIRHATKLSENLSLKKMEEARTQHIKATKKMEEAKIALEEARRKFETAETHAKNTKARLQTAAKAYGVEDLTNNPSETWNAHFLSFQIHHRKCQFVDSQLPPEQRDWMLYQREARRRPIDHPLRLLPHQEMLLEDLDHWDWDPSLSAWDVFLDKLIEFKRVHGHVFVERDDDPELFQWLQRLQRQYKRKHKGLTAEKIRKLEEVGVIWQNAARQEESRRSHSEPHVGTDNEWKVAKDEAIWMERFQELVKLKIATGACNVPCGSQEYARLANWVQRQREHKQSRHSSLTKKRIELLNDLGFSWTTTSPSLVVWDKRYRELVEYKHEHGDCLVPRMIAGGLGNWVHAQRQCYCKLKQGRDSPMTPRQLELLEEIGFVWDPYEYTWDSRFKDLVAYKVKHGNCDVPLDNPRVNPLLSKFVRETRGEHRNLENGKTSKMTRQQAAILEEIGFRWKTHANLSWEDRFKQLLRYKEKHGTPDVRQPPKVATVDDHELFRWVKRQRYQNTLRMRGEKSKITEEQVKRMEAIGFPFRIGRGRRKSKQAKESSASKGSVSAEPDSIICEEKDNCATAAAKCLQGVLLDTTENVTNEQGI